MVLHVSRLSLMSNTYAGGGWLPWLSTSNVDTLNRTQNRNLRIITGQLASTTTDALRVEAGFQSLGLYWKGHSDSTRRPTRGPFRRIQELPGNLREALMHNR
jgi:hypothetical protein